MKNYLLIICVFTVLSSCDNQNTIADDLVGDWSFSEDEEFTQTFGSTTFNSDNSGRGTSFVYHPTVVDFEWELLRGEQKLKITEANWGSPSFKRITYDIRRVDENNFVIKSLNGTINLTRK